MPHPEDPRIPRLLVRADEGLGMGVGHVMRCLALAQQWVAAGGSVTWIGSGPDSPLAARWRKLDADLIAAVRPLGGAEDAAQCLEVAQQQRPSCIVADGYHLGADYQRALKEQGWPLLYIDDHGRAGEYIADFVLDQNLGTHPGLYARREPGTRLLLGASFVLLRQEFLEHRTRVQTVGERARSILVTLGGSDPENATGRILNALGQTDLGELGVTVLIGPRHPNEAALRQQAGRLGRFVQIRTQTEDMAGCMAAADLAVGAGGTTAWEFAFMQVPSLLTILVDNQETNVVELAKAGIAVNLGWASALQSKSAARAIASLVADQAARQRMAERGRQLIDGCGAYRVWLRLAESQVRLRPAAPEDCAMVWEWANEPGVRAASFHSEPIPWETHAGWFESQITQPGSRIWIASGARSGEPLGQVRLKAEGEVGIISLSLSPAQRHRRQGGLLIWLACRRAFAEMSVNRVQAWIKPVNEASKRVFEKVGFRPAGSGECNGQPALIYELHRRDVHE